MANAMLQREDAAEERGVNKGYQLGMQAAFDLAVLCLRDPEVMGKDTFGPTRILKFMEVMGNLLEQYAPAWHKDPEADYMQEMLDANLKEAYGGTLEFTFYERYPMIKKERYDKKRKYKK